MPAKSRRNRGKNLPPSIRAKTGASKNIVETVATEEAAPAVTVQTPVAPKAPSRARGYQVPEEKTYPYIKPELRSIGILAVVGLVILAVLAIIL